MGSDQEKSKAQLIAELQETREQNSHLQSDLQNCQQGVEGIQESIHLVQGVLDGLSINIALLDKNGDIILVNRAWREFAWKNGASPRDVCEGINYLRVCDEATGDFSDEARPFAQGIRSVLSGETDEFSLEYPCHSPEKNAGLSGVLRLFHYQATKKQ